jgi:hypothetical protein
MFQLYLELVGLKDKWNTLNPMQQTETKRAFFGGLGILFVALTDEVTKYSDDDGARILEKLQTDIDLFWKGEINGLRFKFRNN